MGIASYAITSIPDHKWAISHDGKVEGDYLTREAAFEAAVAAASLAIREGHAIQISAPGFQATGEKAMAE
jgi:hypothetical protein